MYELLFSPQAERFFKRMKEKPLKEAYKTALIKLKKNPYIGQPKRGDLVSEVNGKKVIVLLAGTRENFYEQLKRYIK